VIVDIYSRYLFEKEVFERRAQSELSADEINDIMERAQKATYGDGLDEKYPAKIHVDLEAALLLRGFSFYNYPYAFGLLFATGLYAIYQKRGADFVPAYKELLATTGEANAAELADNSASTSAPKSSGQTASPSSATARRSSWMFEAVHHMQSVTLSARCPFH
jgi:oligoendopeptidase F